MLAAGAAGASLPPPTAPPAGPGAGGPFPVGHRLGPGGHGAQSLQAQRRSDLGAGAAHGPCGSLGRKGRPGRAGSRPQHPQPQPPPWELALQLANQPCPSRLVSAALSGPTPGAGCRGVCVGGAAGSLVGKAASSDPPGRGRLPALAHARLSRADAPRVCSEKSCVTPACHSWASRPVKGSPRGFWEWPTQRGGHRAERAGGLAPAPAHRTGGKAFAPRAAERLATAQLALEGMGRDGGRRLVLSVTSSLRSASWGAEGPCPVSMSEGT